MNIDELEATWSRKLDGIFVGREVLLCFLRRPCGLAIACVTVVSETGVATWYDGDLDPDLRARIAYKVVALAAAEPDVNSGRFLVREMRRPESEGE